MASPLSGVRSLFECPILDDRKWKKLPDIDADAFLLDLEDSVPSGGKTLARTKVLDFLHRPDHFGHKLALPRANSLATPWGRDDLIAFAEAGAEVVVYPKAESVREVEIVLGLLREHGSRAQLIVGIETARGVLEADRILAEPDVVGAMFGPGDLAVDAKVPMLNADGGTNDVLVHSKTRAVLAAAASRVPILGMAYVADVTDLELVRGRAEMEKGLGFSGCSAFYPPHVEIINEVFSVSRSEREWARQVVDAYQAASAAGRPSVRLASGELILLHQYKNAQQLLARDALAPVKRSLGDMAGSVE